MQKYVIAIGSPEISRQVQKALFSAGFKWPYGCGGMDYTSSAFITLNFQTGRITEASDSARHTRFIRDGAKLVSSQDAISDPFQFEGAKSPVKEMTVAQLEAKLGHPIKVVKG
jgi:hypothetical protein